MEMLMWFLGGCVIGMALFSCFLSIKNSRDIDKLEYYCKKEICELYEGLKYTTKIMNTAINVRKK